VTLAEQGSCSLAKSDAGGSLDSRGPTGLAFRANLDELPSYPEEVGEGSGHARRCIASAHGLRGPLRCFALSFQVGGTSAASEGRV